MVRAPCCEKMGLKKGPWTPEEDKILVDYIQLHGHENWRKLPKLAGLLRCGKSCRLRWTNYLRPDIKRGNFSREEEDTIIQLHGMLGNRWSAIAARLPGRTDNEIKNVWHTHLKKRVVRDDVTPRSVEPVTESPSEEGSSSLTVDCPNNDHQDCSTPVSPDQHCSSSISSVIAGDDQNMTLTRATSLVDMDESFWAEVLSAENPGREEEFWAAIETRDQQEDISSNLFEATDFWCDLLARAELPEVWDLSPEIMF